jgi:hypothetical protein
MGSGAFWVCPYSAHSVPEGVANAQDGIEAKMFRVEIPHPRGVACHGGPVWLLR